MFGNYYECREWLESFIPLVYTRDNLGLKRIKYLLKLLGNPENKFKSVHIAGTSGKGSTAFYLVRLLQGFGVRGSVSSSSHSTQRLAQGNLSQFISSEVERLSGTPSAAATPRSDSPLTTHHSSLKIGLHISPHLVDIRERMQIFGQPATRDQPKTSLMPMNRFIRLMNEVKSRVEKIQMEKPDLTPSYFEILTAASFLYFAQEKVDWAVVEVGLGGRLDATNVLKPELVIITNIGLDHTEILGNTIAKIAYEKAGIIKTGIPTITAAQGEALKIIKKVARQKKSRLIKINTHEVAKELSLKTFPDGSILAISTLKELGIFLNQAITNVALADTFPGRFEEIDQGVILDGAHNPDKIRALTRWIKNAYGLQQSADSKKNRVVSGEQSAVSITLIVAFKKGKNWKKMIDLLIKNLPIKKIIATKFYAVTDTGRFAAVDPREISTYVKKVYRLPTTVYSNSQEAVFEALRLRSGSTTILITGSLYLVGETRTIWYLPSF